MRRVCLPAIVPTGNYVKSGSGGWAEGRSIEVLVGVSAKTVRVLKRLLDTPQAVWR